MVLLGLSSSAVYLWIASALGMPVPHPWSVWLFGAFVVTAVGVTSASLIAALGSMGTLISLFVFLFFGLPDTGATIPLEASPRFFSWLAGFEPMRQAFLGSRALLYFDGRADAGLSRSIIVGVIGLGIGLLFGAVVTWLYDRKGIHRIEAAAEPAAPAESAAPKLQQATTLKSKQQNMFRRVRNRNLVLRQERPEQLRVRSDTARSAVSVSRYRAPPRGLRRSRIRPGRHTSTS